MSFRLLERGLDQAFWAGAFFLEGWTVESSVRSMRFFLSKTKSSNLEESAWVREEYA